MTASLRRILALCALGGALLGRPALYGCRLLCFTRLPAAVSPYATSALVLAPVAAATEWDNLDLDELPSLRQAFQMPAAAEARLSPPSYPSSCFSSLYPPSPPPSSYLLPVQGGVGPSATGAPATKSAPQVDRERGE